MMRVEVYPAINGLVVRLAGSCVDLSHKGQAHRGNSVLSTIEWEKLESMGVVAAVSLELTLLLHENADITHRAWC
jgi:hypothetical protein